MESVTTMDRKYITKIVAASLLGDATIYIPNDGSKNAKLVIAQTEEHKDYIDLLADVLGEITNVSISEPKTPKHMPQAKKQIFLTTRVHPFYTNFRQRMYPNGCKIVDPHYLTLLDWEFLAHWYVQDGHISSRMQGSYQDIQSGIATHSFSYGDNLLLKEAIKDKLGIEYNIRSGSKKDGSRVYHLALRRSSLPRFLENITPFIVPSFQYKVRTISPII